MRYTSNAETAAGTATVAKIEAFDHCRRINSPPKVGPRIDPMRPMPRLQPIPVDRSDVG